MKTKQNGMFDFLSFSTEVGNAIAEKKPILAIESTVISHGLPYPQNLEVAQELEACARQNQVVPAIIAVIDGVIKIGLTIEEIIKLADNTPLKASCRDLAYVVAQKKCAGTTVALTAMIAAKAHIKVFATGGIGGVHRGESFDISADLTAITKTPLAIISSGPKAILDIPRTMEMLEMLSVPTFGYQTSVMPLFYSSESDYPLPYCIDSDEALVDVVKTHYAMGLESACLIMNPIPKEDEIPFGNIEPVIEKALVKAAALNISGKNTTPFLLEELNQLTNGMSVKANIALLKNNICLGARIAYLLNEEKINASTASGF